MREIVHLQAGQCGNQIGAKVRNRFFIYFCNQESTKFKEYNVMLTYIL